jgi:hypothetical protein
LSRKLISFIGRLGGALFRVSGVDFGSQLWELEVSQHQLKEQGDQKSSYQPGAAHVPRISPLSNRSRDDLRDVQQFRGSWGHRREGIAKHRIAEGARRGHRAGASCGQFASPIMADAIAFLFTQEC